MNNPIVNIVMPVHNRWNLTKQSLDSLFANTDHEMFSLHVIDDGSDEVNWEALYLYWQKAPDFNIYRNKPAISPGASRNKVCDYITKHNWRGKYLYHSDNDVYFMPGWLRALVGVYETVESQGVRLLGGGCHPYLQDNKQIWLVASVYKQCEVGIKDAVSGYSQLMTWETWDTYGPFDETMRDAEMKIMGSEDWAFCQKIVKDNLLVGSVREECVIHCGKTNTYGNPATGNETFKQIPGIIIE